MTEARVSESDFIALFRSLGATATARKIGIGVRQVQARRARIEKRLGISLVPPTTSPNVTRVIVEHPGKIDLDIPNGVVLIASDCHYWPGRITTAHKAFVSFCKDMKPKAVILNGDVLDGATISKYSPIGWENRPALVAEIEACKERLLEIERAAKNAKLIWTLGNHDARFETRLATVAPEYAKVHGVHLKDHFPYWHPAWAAVINGSVVVKHRFKNGIHATHNNTVWAGMTMATGHLHSLKVTPFSDYAGTRYGIDTGTLAEPYGDQFADYSELNPVNWRSGFIVLTFHKGRLLWPEVAYVCGSGQIEFRGSVINL